MKSIKWLSVIILICGAACARSQANYNEAIDKARDIFAQNPDSAAELLEAIDPSALTVDSIKAKYYYAIASAHDSRSHLMLSDSLIRFSADYYRNRDLPRAVGSATLLAAYYNRTGRSAEAITILDSLAALKNLPDSLLILPLREKAYMCVGAIEGYSVAPILRRLIEIDSEKGWKHQYEFWLYVDHLYNNSPDSAVFALDRAIDTARRNGWTDNLIDFEYEKIGVLEEAGRYAESMNLADKWLTNDSHRALHYVHLWKSLTLFNMGDIAGAAAELQRADSCTTGLSDEELTYYNSFTYVLKTVMDYKATGKLRLIRMAMINNNQKNKLQLTQSVRREAEQSALMLENKRLQLKARSDRQVAIVIIAVLATILISGGALWYARDRRRRAIEATERAEILQKLVDESAAGSSSHTQSDALRRAMLQQLGIIRMVAETPTEQNREMLRKISSIDSPTGDALVNWRNVYDIIDNLYSGFYSALHERHGHTLTQKEEQIIVLILAGFSTKEIGVITSQSAATIYVRKSSIRKKLGVPEKEDIIAFIRPDQHPDD